MYTRNAREKLINAIIFFATNTNYCGKVKLFKLLYFLDFRHYQERGRSVTGLDYFAWDMGPVPKELREELRNPKPDFSQKIELTQIPTNKGNEMLGINPSNSFSPKYFTKRELRIMKELSEEYRDTKAKKMIKDSHLENQPWHQIYEVENKKDCQIPYDLALRKQNKDLMLQKIADHEQMINNGYR
jgi:uncharacterized phage-associated protein